MQNIVEILNTRDFMKKYSVLFLYFKGQKVFGINMYSVFISISIGRARAHLRINSYAENFELYNLNYLN